MQGLICYPFLITKDGKNVARAKRGVVPMAELTITSSAIGTTPRLARATFFPSLVIRNG